mmetsp:Transcript_17985/g.33518  ORF Transcript_17985/g.33518 Transcript_17985/m.33518 type:complete len:303 (+) Transcript_17985:354-1262(+)
MFSSIPTIMSQNHLPQQLAQLSSHISSSLLSIRGGSELAQSETVNSIYIKSAVGYFNNLRVPAAVLMSIIMKEMFVLQSTPASCMRKWDKEHRIHLSKRWRTLRYTYLLLMVLAFSLETFTIFVATQVLTQLATAQQFVPMELNGDNSEHQSIGGGFFNLGAKKELHVSMIDFLMKNFEFEYATCRCYFMTGLLSFTVATALRLRYALRKYSDLSYSGMCCLLTVAAGMLTYSNANSVTYGGYVNLIKRQLGLHAEFLRTRIRRGPMSLITVFFTFLTLSFAIKGMVSTEFAYFDLDDEDDK